MKKIAVNTVKAFLKENQKEAFITRTFRVGDGVFDVAFRTALSVDEKSAFIRRVLSGCFDAAGDYRPEYFVPVFKATVLQMCTNLPPLTMKNETAENGGAVLDLDGMSELYEVIRGIWLLGDTDTVRAGMKRFEALLAEMQKLCQAAVQWKKERLRADAGPGAALRRLLDTLTEKMDAVDMVQFTEYIGGLSEAVKGLEQESAETN